MTAPQNNPRFKIGTLATRPLASSVPQGMVYVYTDALLLGTIAVNGPTGWVDTADAVKLASISKIKSGLMVAGPPGAAFVSVPALGFALTSVAVVTSNNGAPVGGITTNATIGIGFDIVSPAAGDIGRSFDCIVIL